MFLLRRFASPALLLSLFLLAAGNAPAHQVADPLEAAATAPAVSAPVEELTGTVHRLVIEDRVAGATTELVSLETDDGVGMALRGDQTRGYVTGDRVAATGRRNGKAFFTGNVRRVSAAAKAPATAKARTAALRGKLALLHEDYFESDRSVFRFELQDAAGVTTRLKFPVLPEALQSGMEVVVQGTSTPDATEVTPDTVSILSMPGATTAKALAKAATTNNALVILMTFTDSPAVPFTQAAVQNVVGGGAGSGSVAEYFKEVSFGQQLLTATVTPWLPTNAATPASCNWSQMGTLGRNAATAAGYNLASYSNIVYVFPPVSACGWIGLGYVGASGVWINGRNATSVYGHELGHNFGLLHAASLRCGSVPIGGSCTASEYGDPFDIMGNQSAMHFNAAQKADLGWIAASTVQTHTQGTGTYVLQPIETGGGTLYAVKIPAATNRTYWLEYRQPIGFDSALANYPNSGVQVRVASPFETLCSGCDAYSNDTELLDMTPATSAFTDAALLVGKSYTDSTYGININVVSASSSGLTVQVTKGTVTATTSAVASSLNPATLGAAVTFTASVTGASPTGTVVFTDGGAAISGCGAVALTGTGNVRTAACSTSTLASGTHVIAARYAGDTSNAASTSLSLSQAITSSAPTVAVTSPAQNATFNAGDTVTVVASAADADGTVSRVAFYSNGVQFASFSGVASPYSAPLSGLAAGTYALTAVATDNSGLSTTSVPVNITVASGASGTSSSTVTLQDGANAYAGTRDTFLSAWNKTAANGASAALSESGSYVDLVRFAIFQSEGGPVPNGATITSAQLSLYKTTDYDFNYEARRMLADWTEAEATWNQRKSGLAWSVAGAGGAGADYAATADASAGVGYAPGWLTFDITAGMQALASGQPNYGWRLKEVSGNTNEKRFASRESATQSLRPKLVVTYRSTSTGGGNVAPSVAIGSPADGATFAAGAIISVAAAASDSDGTVSKVEFYRDGVLVATDTAAPYAVDLANLPAGSYTLTAIATDNAGASTTSAAVHVSVVAPSNIAPTVSITNPANAATFATGTAFTVSATAVDSDGTIAKVQFFSDGTSVGTAISAPYSVSVAGLAAGTHVLTAVATDNAGAATTSAAVSVTITSTTTGSGTVTLQDGANGYAGTRDTFLSAWNKTVSNGAGALMLESGSYTDLVRFAIFQSEGGPVPDGATITSAQLGLYKTTDYDYTYEARRMLVDWAEAEATWNQRKAGLVWSAAGAAGPGADYSSTADATASVAYAPGWLVLDVRAGVQALSSGQPNYGWRLKEVSGNSNEKRFAAREYAAQSLRPKLVVSYTVP